MQRNIYSVTFDRDWTAWDANTHVYRQPPKVRKRLRRLAKRRWRQKDQITIREELYEKPEPYP